MGYPTFKQVLKHTRQQFEKDAYGNNFNSRYICINIEHALKDKYNINYDSILVKRYQKIVQDQLENGDPTCNTYEKWMKKYHPTKYNQMSYDNFREGRLQWIDHMLTRKDL